MARYRVLIVYHYLAHYRRAILLELLGNQASNSYEIAADITAEDPSLKVLTPADFGGPDRLGRRWRLINNQWYVSKILWQKGLLRLVVASDYDGVIFLGNVYFLSTWLAAVIARIRKIKVFMWTHGFLDQERGVKGFVRMLFYNLADSLLVYGVNGKRILEKKGFKKRVAVIFNSLNFQAQEAIMTGITEKEVAAQRKLLDLEEDSYVLLGTGRLIRSKRFDLLIDALELLIKKGAKYTLLLIGDGPDRSVLEYKVRQGNLERRVRFLGACYDERRIGEIMACSDVAVIPGDVGLSAIHSLAYGVPVVTHDRKECHKPEFEAIIDGVNGGFYRYGDVEDLAKVASF